MTFIQGISIFAFAIFSIVDLRTRLVPFIDVFFALVAVFTFRDNPLHVGTLAVAVAWGVFWSIPSWIALPFIFVPVSWPILLIGFGVRKQMVGKADLFALGIIGSLFPIFAVIAALLGFELWRRWWMNRGNCGLIPAVPGLFLGLAGYSIVQLGIQYFHVLPV